MCGRDVVKTERGIRIGKYLVKEKKTGRDDKERGQRMFMNSL